MFKRFFRWLFLPGTIEVHLHVDQLTVKLESIKPDTVQASNTQSSGSESNFIQARSLPTSDEAALAHFQEHIERAAQIKKTVATPEVKFGIEADR
jgi:hypothetical protein